MPVLDNPRHEAFARAVANGVRRADAYEDAGFAPGHGHAGRLMARPEVVRRITELRAQNEDFAGATPHVVIGALVRLARTIGATEDPASVRELRLTLVEISRLYAQAREDRAVERRHD